MGLAGECKLEPLRAGPFAVSYYEISVMQEIRMLLDFIAGNSTTERYVMADAFMLQIEALSVLRRARKVGALDIALRAIAESARLLELAARLLKQIHVAETEEKAIENARQFLWMQGEFTGLAHTVWSTPTGYYSPENRRAFVESSIGRSTSPRARPALEGQGDDDHRRHPEDGDCQAADLLEQTRPGIFAFWGNDGTGRTRMRRPASGCSARRCSRRCARWRRSSTSRARSRPTSR